ncbi:MAG: extracellular solute-binding protein [Caldilineaceae bacterium]|nr:extracellular solute-binding protein [Caldilineaceae bacterium]
MFKKSMGISALLVAVMLLLAACPGGGGGGVAAPTATTEPTAEAAATEPAAEEPAASDTVTETTTTTDTATTAPTGECAVAAEGELAGVDPTGQTVVWWHNHSGSRAEGLQGLIAEFNSNNPCGITVDAQNQGGYDDIRDKVNASIGAGELPAALIVGYQNDQAFYQLNDTLVDLNLYVNDATWGLTAEEQADFYPAFFEQSVHPVFDNQRLGFPPNRSMEVLYYNATLLEELGYSAPPATPEEFKEMACAAHAADPNNKGYLLRDDASAVASWTYAFGGDILNEAGDGYVLNGQATIDSLTLLKSMYDEGCANFLDDPAGFPNAEFAARRTLFAQGSSSGIPFYANDTKTVAEEAGREADVWGVAAIPHTTAEPVQNIYGGDVMITVTTPEQQLAAWLFIKWFTSPEVQAKWDEISGYFPTRVSTVEYLQEYLASNPQWAQAVELLPYSAYEPQLISYTGVRDGMREAFNAIIQGADIQATLDALTEDANAQQEELMSEVQ